MRCFALLRFAGQTIDDDLERENFKHAGEALASLWDEQAYAGHPIVSEYHDPPEGKADENAQPTLDHEFMARHVRHVLATVLFACAFLLFVTELANTWLQRKCNRLAMFAYRVLQQPQPGFVRILKRSRDLCLT